MRYFADYTKAATPVTDIDLSVHCDIGVFDWLLRFLTLPPAKRPRLGRCLLLLLGAHDRILTTAEVVCIDVSMVVSILISAEFLKMDALMEECGTTQLYSLPLRFAFLMHCVVVVCFVSVCLLATGERCREAAADLAVSPRLWLTKSVCDEQRTQIVISRELRW